MKKIQLKILLILMLLITLVTTISNASYENVTMTVVEEPTCTINFGTNSTVERSVISKNLEEKEITFQLKVTNEETMLKPTGELMLVIDNSNSMTSEISEGVTREDVVIESAKTLITNILQDNEKLKIGIVSFSSDATTGGGTEADAKLVSELTNNTTELLSKVSNIEYNGPLTNLDSAINLAPNYFSSEDNNKYIVVLTDGVPNIAIGNNKYFSEAVIEKTKTSLSALKNVADNVIIMLTGITEGDSIPGGSQAENKLTYNQIIQEVFGTEQSPKEGIDKFYYVTDSEVEKTITEDIYKDLLPISQSFSDIIVKDYFSKEIVDNFDFSYVKQPNMGTITEGINKEDNSITWTIPELKSGETAIVQYKLKLKENYSDDILDKVLDTHTNLNLDYTDFYGNTDTKSSDITPKVKLTEPKVEQKVEPKKEPEQKPTVLPDAGLSDIITITIMSSLILISIISGIKYIKIRK